MKLEKFRNISKKNITIKLSTIIIIIILLVGIIIYQSYALYEEKKSFNVLNGTVPVFGEISSPIELAFTVDGKKTNSSFPKKESDYIAKSVICESGVEAEWNNGLWGLINIKNNTNKEKVSCTIDFTKAKVYGIKREIASTSSAWTRTDASVGKVANAQFSTTAVQNDFDSIYPWSEIKSYTYNTSTKEITAWYGSSDFKFDGTNGEVLTYIPEFYYKRNQEGGYEYIQISKRPKEGYTKSEAFSVGRYPISGSDSGVHSKSGVMPLVNTTIANYRTYARNLGSGFGQMDWHYFLIQILYLVEYADYNSQTKLGLGNAGNNNSIVSGGCDNLGMHSGTLNNDGKHSIIYRGIEDIYGNVWQMIDGINIKNHQVYICYEQNQYVSDKYDGCYKKLGYINSNVNGYTSKLGYDANNSLIALPIETLGTSSTYTCDTYYQDNRNNNENNIFFAGGRWGEAFTSGFWYFSCDNVSNATSSNFGSRLIKY